jgi:uncharacterized membrane protein YfcA
MAGAKCLTVARTSSLRLFFSVLVFLMAVEMIYSGCIGRH